MSLRSRFLAGAVLLALAAVARADTVITLDGQTVKGRTVEEDGKTLKIRGKYGVLVIPKGDIKSRQRGTYVVTLNDGEVLTGQVLGEGKAALKLKVGDAEKSVKLADIASVSEKKTAPKPKKLSARQVMALHRKARAHWDKKQYDKAIGEYAKILASRPEDTIALYNTACGYALTGKKNQALIFLKKSVEAGYVNFTHMETDKDLDSLRGEEAYKQLFKNKAEYIRKSSGKAVSRISRGLASRGIDAKKYKKHFDRERNFVYLHTRSDEEFKQIRTGLEEYAEYQWKHLFQNKPAQPLYIVLLNSRDTPRFFRGRAGGVFQPAMNTLFCGDAPAYKLLKANVIVHEFTHALHFADMSARRQRHPIWLIEGLSTLFESSDRAAGGVKPRHSYRLTVVQNYLKRGRLNPWSRHMKLTHPQFMRIAGLAYAQSRYMLFYMYEKGLLKKFYDEYTKGEGYKGDKTAADAYEVVFGKPLAEVENDWKKWIRKQKVPPMPYLGVGMKLAGPGKVAISRLASGGPAAKAGLKVGDVLISVGGQPISEPGHVIGAVGSHKVGEKIEVELQRGEKKMTITLTLGKRGGTAVAPRKGPRPYLGIAVMDKGGKLFVREVDERSPAARAGLEAGMEILEVGGSKVTSIRGYLAIVKKARVGQELKIKVRSGEKERTLTAQISELPTGK